MLTLIAGAAAILAGALKYTRGILGHWASGHVVLTLLSIVAIVTGIIHLTGQTTESRVYARNTTLSPVMMSTFEIGFGALILGQGRGALMNDVMAARALAGGVILLGDAA